MKNNLNSYVLLAKSAIEVYIKERKIIKTPDDLPEKIKNEKAGVFVTIKKNGNLRGCIGTYLPTKENIAQEIIHNTVAAAIEDYRFGPIQKEELPYLSYAVYILERPELVKDIKTLNPKKYGIIIKTSPITYPDGSDVVFNGHFVAKSALLLPDLEGIDTVEKQIAIACQKARIDPNIEKLVIYKFKVKKFND